MEARSTKTILDDLKEQTTQAQGDQHLASGLEDIQIGSDEDIYDAIENRGYLQKPGFPTWLGIHLIQQGEIGLLLDNGNPVFLAPGRYTFESPLKKFLGTKSISDARIDLGPIQIVTINQGELGLSTKNGKNIILEPGRYFLEAPHKFVKSVLANQRVIELGTHRRITVPEGYVFIAIDDGEQIIITPSHEGRKGPYITDSPTFLYNADTCLQPTQRQVVELEKLTVNTKEMIPIKIEGLITYRISDPKTAFLSVNDVHGAIKRQAEATLTSVFAHLSIDEIAASLSTDRATSLKEKEHESVFQEDFIHKATTLFLDEYKEIVRGWGVELENLNIEKMEFVDKQFADALRKRAQSRMETDTNLVNADSSNLVELKQAEREKQQAILRAEGEAESMKIMANGRYDAAKLDTKAAEELSSQPLAAKLAILKTKGEIVEKMGNNTVFMPHGFKLNPSISKNGSAFFAHQNVSTCASAQLYEAEKEPRASMLTVGAS